MSSINPNLFSTNSSDWQFKASDKKTDQPNTISELASKIAAGGIANIQENVDFKSMVEMFSNSSKTSAYTSTTIEGYAEYNLKAAFQLDNGQNVNLELQVKIDYKFQQATEAYAKNKQKSDTKTTNSDEFSPENTAKRIGDFAMGFLSAYQSNHADQTNTDSVNGFFDLAKNAISKGFDQAKEILGGLYGQDATKTFDIVSQFLDNAKSTLLGTGEKTDTTTVS